MKIEREHQDETEYLLHGSNGEILGKSLLESQQGLSHEHPLIED